MRRAPIRQRLLVPAYFTPGPDWEQLDMASSIAIVNPASGPGMARDAAYAALIARSRAAGIAVIGYVDTDYARRPLSDVRRDCDAYADWYGVDGIFLDQVSAERGALAYYTEASAAIKAGNDAARVVLNPGARVPQAFMRVADIIVTFENTADAYRTAYAAAWWMRRYPPERFCHLVYAAPTTEALQQVIALSRKRRAGWLYITPDTLPNPWSALPPAPYWTEERNEIM